MTNEHDQKILAGALAAIVRVLLSNGNDIVRGTAFVDGYFFKIEIKITKLEE